MKKIVFNIVPMGAVRMNRGDLIPWKLKSGKARPAVYKYLEFKDRLKALCVQNDFVMPESNYWIKFYLPISESWSKKKKEAMLDQPHQQKPDKDNLEKAFLDTVCQESGDARIWDGRVSKYWSDRPRIEILYGT